MNIYKYMKPVNKGMSLYNIQKMLLSNSKGDNLIAWEILINRYGTISRISYMFFEEKLDMQIYDAKEVGIIYQSNNKYLAAIVYRENDGVRYKLIER